MKNSLQATNKTISKRYVRLCSLVVIAGLAIGVYILLPKSALIIDNEPAVEMLQRNDYEISKQEGPPEIPGFVVEEYRIEKKQK